MILRLVSGAAVAFALVLTGAVAAVFVAPPSVAACGDETCEARVPSDARLHLPSGLKPFAELVNMERKPRWSRTARTGQTRAGVPEHPRPFDAGKGPRRG
jgi:hypothetical protein